MKPHLMYIPQDIHTVIFDKKCSWSLKPEKQCKERLFYNKASFLPKFSLIFLIFDISYRSNFYPWIKKGKRYVGEVEKQGAGGSLQWIKMPYIY